MQTEDALRSLRRVATEPPARPAGGSGTRIDSDFAHGHSFPLEESPQPTGTRKREMPNGTSSQAAAADAENGKVQPGKASGPDPLLGRMVNDRFRVISLIARGGMGKVYKAEQAPLGRVCAIKVLNPNYSGDHDPEFHKRFFLEASISSKLTHPNTVTIFDYGRTEDNIYYMAMEFLEGRTLHRTLREEGPFNEERTTHIARQICRSLREAHSLGVIHRDLKPANVYLIEHGDETDFVKVLDFGLVKNIDETKGEDLTQTGLFMGSPKYMAPEQIRGEHVDARTDIYALGIMMYEMLTGKVPFDRPNSVNILMAHVNEAVPPIREMNPNCQVGEAFEGVVMRCVEKNPDDRFKSMDELLAGLKRTGAGAMTGTISGSGIDRSGSFDLLSTTGSFTPSGTNAISGSIQSLSPDSGRQSASGGLLGTSGTVSPGSEQKKNRTPLIIGAAVAAVAVIGIALAASSGGSTKSAAKDPAVATPVAAPVKPVALASDKAPAVQAPSAPPAPADLPTRVKVESIPDGAVVKEDSAIVCDKTPCELEVTDKGRKVTLELKDYDSVTLALSKSDKVRSIALSRTPVKWSPGPSKAAPDVKAAKPNPDFKDNPY
jgi:serine/threonine protein kinase